MAQTIAVPAVVPFDEIEGVAPAELDYTARRGRGSRPSARLARPERPARAGGGLPTPLAPAKERPAHAKQQPAVARSARSDPAAHSANGATVTPFPRAAAPRRPRQPERNFDEDRKIIGFGDDLPAFLARPPRVVARP